jgi:hypothetical protein
MLDPAMPARNDDRRHAIRGVPSTPLDRMMFIVTRFLQQRIEL